MNQRCRESTVTSEQGSMTVLMAGLVCVVTALLAGLTLIASTMLAAERARAAADQAALAAANVLLNPAAGQDPCRAGQALAARNGARVVTCNVRETSVQVDVVLPALPVRDATAQARAGAPEGGHAHDATPNPAK